MLRRKIGRYHDTTPGHGIRKAEAWERGHKQPWGAQSKKKARYKARAKGQLKPLGAQLARNLEERYSTLPFAERWAFPMLEKPFPEADEASRQSKWNALIKKLISIRFLETYHVLACADGGNICQFEHTIHVTDGGPEILTVE